MADYLLSLQLPHMHNRFGSVGILLQYIEDAICLIIGNITYSAPTLVAPSKLNFIPLGWFEIEIFVDVDHGIRLRLPGFDLPGSDSSQVRRVIQDDLGIKTSCPPTPVAETSSILFAAATRKTLRWAGAPISQSAGGEIGHIIIYAGILRSGRVNVAIPIFRTGALGPCK